MNTNPQFLLHRLFFLLVALVLSAQVPVKPGQPVVKTGLEILLTEAQDIVKGKTVGLVTNLSGIDSQGRPNYQLLMALPNTELAAIFTPEHGLFGQAAAGETVADLQVQGDLPPVYSLYGETRKPTPEILAGLDLILYDIQDVGARFYTYITTLGLVMEAAAAAGIPVVVLDRPNPLTGSVVEGPVLDLEFRSFVGYYPIPIRYGLTIGELAGMICGERWIDPVPALEIVKMKGWERSLWYDQTGLPWVKPSPNIPDLETAIVYPGLCLLEAVNVNEGRGTPTPFTHFGAPWIRQTTLLAQLDPAAFPGVHFEGITYTPKSLPGMAPNPRYRDRVCRGLKLTVTDRERFRSVETFLKLMELLRTQFPDSLAYREAGMQRLWGNNQLVPALKSGKSAADIQGTFTEALSSFNKRRQAYLLY